MTEGWVGLELRHLVALQAIADEGSFKAAARALGYTPSAISQQIASLERVVGVQVIAREHGKQALGLTEAGRVLLGHMAAIDARLSAAKADIDALAQGAVGTLHVGAFESVGARLLPELITRFGERLPKMRIEVDEAVTELGHLRSVEEGVLDLAFTFVPLLPGPFETKTIAVDPWVLVVQAGSELTQTRAAPIDLETLGGLPLACFRSPRAMESVLTRMRDAGIEPRVVLRSDYNEALQEFAAGGRGVALMPILSVNPRDERTAIVDLGDLIPPREIVIAWHCERLPSVARETFVTLAVEIGSNVAQDPTAPNSPGPNSLSASTVTVHGRSLESGRRLKDSTGGA